MKKIAYFIAVLLLAAGCTEKPGPDNPPADEEKLSEKMAGEWHCVISGIDADIYLSLSAGSFELYQQIGDGAHRLYQGSWSVDEKTGTLTGKYNDGQPWGSAYGVTISEDRNIMTLVPEDITPKEEHIYRREEIPSEVKDKCVIPSAY